MLGSREVTQFQREGKQYKVLVQAPQAQRVTPNDLNNIYLRSAGDRLIPLASLVRLDERSEEHTSELQSLMRISYAVFCLKKKKHIIISHTETYTIQCTKRKHHRHQPNLYTT